MKIKTGLKTDNVVLFPGFVSDGGVIHCGGRKYYPCRPLQGLCIPSPTKTSADVINGLCAAMTIMWPAAMMRGRAGAALHDLS